MSYGIEVAMHYGIIEQNWFPSSARFAEKKEAKQYGADVLSRWLCANDFKVVKSDDPVTHCFNPILLRLENINKRSGKNADVRSSQNGRCKTVSVEPQAVQEQAS